MIFFSIYSDIGGFSYPIFGKEGKGKKLLCKVLVFTILDGKNKKLKTMQA